MKDDDALEGATRDKGQAIRIAIVGGGPATLAVEALEMEPGVDLKIVANVAETAKFCEWADVLVIPDPRGPAGKALSDALTADTNRTQWIQMISAGTQGLTIHPLPRDLVITNHGASAAPGVAEHAMALLLGLVRSIATIAERTGRCEWNRTFEPPLGTLEAKTILVLGVGHIGAEIARRAKAFGMIVEGVNRTGSDHPATSRMFAADDLSHAVSRADVVAVSLAYNSATQGMVSSDILQAMKPGSLLVNVARGELIDQDALIEALRSGHLGGAALDVTVPEPLPADSPLWQMPNTLISPHVAAGGNPGFRRRLAQLVIENVRRYKTGGDLQHAVKFQDL